MTTTMNPRVTASSALLPAPPTYGVRGLVARKVVQRILRGVPVTARLSTGEVYGAPLSENRPVLEVTRPEAFFARLGHSPMIGIGESYMAREWSVGEGTDLADALAPFAERLTDLIKPVFYNLRHTVLPRGLNPANTKDGAKKNIEAHYDLSNDMFMQFLDPSLSYSSALFDSLDTPPALAGLEAAQLAKVDAILDSSGVTQGSRVLEIGTGWGTLAIRAAERGATVTTVTLSVEQAALAQQRVDAAGMTDRVEIAVRDYRDQDGTFDAIVSVEMIEAVGEEYWPEYFQKLDSLLAPGGKVAIQAILIAHDRLVATRNTYTWIHKYIFPGGHAALDRRDQPGHPQAHVAARQQHPADGAALRPHAAAVARAVHGQLAGRPGARLRRPVLPDVGVLPGLLRGGLPHRLPRGGPDPHRAVTQRRSVTVPATRSCRPRRSRL